MRRSILGPELFQNILASAFVVQQSLLNAHWPSVIPELRRLIDSGALSANGTMHLIAGRAQNVANAAGAAIALVTKDKLIYQAGSGSAAGYVGRQVMATLSVSPKVERRGEILRVEDADSDPRIDGAVCRQWAAKSLLILPIYHNQALSGILAVIFNEPHTNRSSTKRRREWIRRTFFVHLAEFEEVQEHAKNSSLGAVRISHDSYGLLQGGRSFRYKIQAREATSTCRQK